MPEFQQILSRNEQVVLYNLVKCPTLSDQEIYDRIGMKQSTYSTIKKKLREEGYYHEMYAPILQHLGCELLVVWYVTLNRKTRTEDRLALTRDQLLAAADVFSIVSESNQAILLSISKNIAEHVRISDSLVQLYEKHDFLESIHFVQFPFDGSAIFGFFDFAPLLNRIFRIEPSEESVGVVDIASDRVQCKVKHVQMNELEKKVYLGLIKHPELSDSALSEKLDCSRQVLSRIKYRFLEDKLIKKRRIVSLDKLGIKILSMIHTKYNPLKPLRERQKCVQNTMTLQTPIFIIARDPESVMLVAFKDFEECKNLQNEYITFCAGQDIIRMDPVMLNLSVPRIHEIKWLVYEPMVRKILDDI
jgi:DNA-binding MarR family transcriptional regulator/DNA-binding Lrp family transcriptional regulator